MMRLSVGTWVSQALSVAAALGVADVIADGPRPVTEIADAVGADAQALYRVLRALGDVGVVEERERRTFALTELGGLLRTDSPGSMRNWAQLVGLPPWRGMWTDLLQTVRTGEPAFERVFGRPPFAYLAEHPEYAGVFDAAMTDLSKGVTGVVVDSYDFRDARTIVDVGGGNGALLAAVLGTSPDAHGVLFDRPEVVPGAQRLLRDPGLTGRCTGTTSTRRRSSPTVRPPCRAAAACCSPRPCCRTPPSRRSPSGPTSR